MNHLQEQTSSRYSNVDTELARVDYGEDFIIHEIFESRDTLIKWAREVAMAQGFFLVVKKSDVFGMRTNGRVLLSCDIDGTYRNRNVKISDKEGARSAISKKCGCTFQLKDKELSNTTRWVLMVVSGIHIRHDMLQEINAYAQLYLGFSDMLSVWRRSDNHYSF